VSGPPDEFAGSGAAIACLCSSDSVYAEGGQAAAAQLKAAGARRVYLAGRPTDEQVQAALTAAGVDEFVFAGGDAVDVVRRALDVLEESS
jgi:methylmalonyl-CoA mutase